MSDGIDSYEPPIRLRKPGRRRRSHTGWGATLLVVILLGGGAFWWLTRDTYPLARLIPAGQHYQLFADDVLTKRAKVAQSRLWQALPASLGWADVPQNLARDFGMPEWVLNNLLPDQCYVSGNDLRSFGDVLFVTRTTRIGCLLAKVSRFLPKAEHDPAGGLHLRRLPEPGLYYAVRGRLLLVSPSRNALIRALTVRPEESLQDKAPEHWKVSGAEDLRGTIAPAPDDPLGRVFDSVSFALRLDSASAKMKCRGVLRPDLADRLGDLLAEVTPGTLRSPPEGMLRVSLNLGKPVQDLWAVAGQAVGKAELFGGLWEQWSTTPPDAPPGLPQIATALLGPLGPGVRFSWRGVDLNEMVPVPEIVAVFDAVPERLFEALAAIPPPPEGVQPWDTYPRYDAETKRVHVPMVGGPSIEPTAGPYGGALLVSSSRTVGDALLDRPPQDGTLSQQGNLYACVRLRPCVQTVNDVAALFAEHNLLNPSLNDTLERVTRPLMDVSAVVDEISALAAYEKGALTADIHVACTESGAKAPLE